MSTFHISRQWINKPDSLVEINWDHPLAEGLEHLFILNEGDGPPLDLVTGEYLSNFVSNPGWSDDENGRYLNGDGASSYWGAINVLPYPITIAANTFSRDKNVSTTALGLGQSASVGGMFILNLMDVNTNDLRTYCRSRSGQAIQFVSGGIGYSENQNYTLAATSVNKNDLRFWVDGEYQGKNTSNHGTNPTWDRFAIMGLTRNTAGAGLDGGVRWSALWSRDLSADEHNDLHENVYKLILPRRTKLFTSQGSGDTAFVAATNGITTIAATLTTRIELSGSVLSHAAIGASLDTSIDFVSAINAQATSSSDLTTGINLIAALAATVVTAPSLTTQIPLSSNTLASASATAELTVGMTIALSTRITANTSATADLTTGISFSTSSAALATIAVQLTTGISLVLNGNIQLETIANLTTGINLESSVIAQCGTVTDMSTGIGFISSINAQSIIAANLFTGGGVGVVYNPDIKILTTRRRIRPL